LEEELGCEDAFVSQISLDHADQMLGHRTDSKGVVPESKVTDHAATTSCPVLPAASAMENSLYFSAVGQPLSANNRSSSSSSLFAIHQDCWGSDSSDEDGSTSSSCGSAAGDQSVAHFADGSMMHSALDQSLAFFSATSAWTRPSLLVVGDHQVIPQISEARVEEEECVSSSEEQASPAKCAAEDSLEVGVSSQPSIIFEKMTVRPQNEIASPSTCATDPLQAREERQGEKIHHVQLIEQSVEELAVFPPHQDEKDFASGNGGCSDNRRPTTSGDESAEPSCFPVEAAHSRELSQFAHLDQQAPELGGSITSQRIKADSFFMEQPLQMPIPELPQQDFVSFSLDGRVSTNSGLAFSEQDASSACLKPFFSTASCMLEASGTQDHVPAEVRAHPLMNSCCPHLFASLTVTLVRTRQHFDVILADLA
jgi:hypothetical protein